MAFLYVNYLTTLRGYISLLARSVYYKKKYIGFSLIYTNAYDKKKIINVVLTEIILEKDII